MGSCLGTSAVLALACGLVSIAAEDPPLKSVLFDGKTLDGWKKVATYKAGAVKVEDGALVLEAGGPITIVASTRSDLPTTDFELAYEAKRIVGEDFFAAATFPVGKSFLTLVNGGWGGGVTGLSSINGADASENETRRFVKYQNNTWYRFRVQVTDDVIRCWVDDKEIFAVNHRGQELKTRIETRPSQPLGFATYRSTGAVRSIQVRKLTAAEVAANNKAAEA
jgi:hypothetical protein